MTLGAKTALACSRVGCTQHPSAVYMLCQPHAASLANRKQPLLVMTYLKSTGMLRLGVLDEELCYTAYICSMASHVMILTA